MPRRELSGTLTIRLPSPLRRRLVRRARAQGLTPSELARQALEQALLKEPAETLPALGERTAGFVGTVASRRVPAGRDARRAGLLHLPGPRQAGAQHRSLTHNAERPPTRNRMDGPRSNPDSAVPYAAPVCVPGPGVSGPGGGITPVSPCVAASAASMCVI